MSELQLECVVYIRLCRRLEDLRSISAASASTAGVPFPHVREARGALCSDATSLICQMRRIGGTLTTEKVGRLVDFSVLFFRLRRRSVFLHRFSNYICTIIVITVKREEYSRRGFPAFAPQAPRAFHGSLLNY